jgi:HSP20 family molecular chaperone IbpA
MAKRDLTGKKVKDLEELSRLWEAEDLLRNLDEEMSRMEQGLGHMIYDLQERRVTTWLKPLPVTPKFDVRETEDEFELTVRLPGIPKDNIRVNVDRNGVEVLACSDDAVCRPHYLSVDASGVLDPDSAQATMKGEVFEVKVSKHRKRRLEIK